MKFSKISSRLSRLANFKQRDISELKDQNLITLKEASQISGYSSDYIGQLIRAGKIPGRQIYCHLAWVTSADAVLEYKNKLVRPEGEKKEAAGNWWKKMSFEYGILKMALSNLASPWIIGGIAAIVIINIVIIYIISLSIGSGTPSLSCPPGSQLTF